MAKKRQDTLKCAVIIEGVRHEASTAPPLKPHQRDYLQKQGALAGANDQDNPSGETSNG